MNRKAKLEKALAFAPNEYNDPWTNGAEWENSRLAPLHEALLAAVEALERAKYEMTVALEHHNHIDILSPLAIAEALSKIDKVLGEM